MSQSTASLLAPTAALAEHPALRGLTVIEMDPLTESYALDGPHAWLVHGLAAREEEIHLANLGVLDFAEPAAAWAATLAHQEDSRVRRVVVLDGPAGDPASVVAWGSLHLPLTGNLGTAYVFVAVAPQLGRRGIGSALHAWAEGVAVAEGRTTAQAWSDFPGPDSGVDGVGTWPVVTPSTGVGELPVTPSLAFALKHGYAVEQADRRSVLTLPVDAALLDELEAKALPHADGYRLHTWERRVPDAWAADWAALCQAMIDAPTGGLDIEEEPWDVARLRRDEAQYDESGMDRLHTAVEHGATGRLVALTSFQWNCPPVDRLRDFAFQDDTIVAREHRGHRLGMLIKIRNLRELMARRPDVVRVHTWNAEENDHMLAINVALGFVPNGGEAGLQKRLA